MRQPFEIFLKSSYFASANNPLKSHMTATSLFHAMKSSLSNFLSEIAENMDTFIVIAILQIILLILVMFLISTEERSRIG
jgi:uncharacterized protein YqhQ